MSSGTPSRKMRTWSSSSPFNARCSHGCRDRPRALDGDTLSARQHLAEIGPLLLALRVSTITTASADSCSFSASLFAPVTVTSTGAGSVSGFGTLAGGRRVWARVPARARAREGARNGTRSECALRPLDRHDAPARTESAGRPRAASSKPKPAGSITSASVTLPSASTSSRSTTTACLRSARACSG